MKVRGKCVRRERQSRGQTYRLYIDGGDSAWRKVESEPEKRERGQELAGWGTD